MLYVHVLNVIVIMTLAYYDVDPIVLGVFSQVFKEFSWANSALEKGNYYRLIVHGYKLKTVLHVYDAYPYIHVCDHRFHCHIYISFDTLCRK